MSRAKRQFKCVWLNETEPRPIGVTRIRIAYLLKAARSRWMSNIERIGNGYLIRDCQFHIIPKP